MLKRLRWKFTGVAMLSVFIVLAIFVTGLNLMYWRVTVGGVDRMLEVIAANKGQIPPYAPRGRGMPPDPGAVPITPETRFETRFFAVRENEDGTSYTKQLDSIAAVTDEDAETFYRRARATGQVRGFLDQYRFYRSAGEDGTVYFFLDCMRQLRSMQNLRRISALSSLAALLGIFALVWLLSGKAIEPTVKGVERQKRFITDASHEIKTPLTVIRSYADVMCLQDGENEWARGIQKESERLTHLVSNLVLLSRWDEQPSVAEWTPFDLSRALWDTLTPYQNLAKTNGKRMEADITEGMTVTGDESALQTAFATLLENAVQYSVSGSMIHFSARREKRRVCVRLSNCCELPEGLDPNRLFDRFYRADDSRSRDTGGSGIGLSIAKAIIEAHGGEISAHLSDGRLFFVVRIPQRPHVETA